MKIHFSVWNGISLYLQKNNYQIIWFPGKPNHHQITFGLPIARQGKIALWLVSTTTSFFDEMILGLIITSTSIDVTRIPCLLYAWHVYSPYQGSSDFVNFKFTWLCLNCTVRGSVPSLDKVTFSTVSWPVNSSKLTDFAKVLIWLFSKNHLKRGWGFASMAQFKTRSWPTVASYNIWFICVKSCLKWFLN